MKQSILISSLLICLISVSFETNLKTANTQEPIARITRKGHQKSKDIGINIDDIWLCDDKGNLLKHSKKAIQKMITGKFDGKCESLDVDKFGMPWVVTEEGNVFKLTKVSDDSWVWHEVYTGKNAVDVACGFETDCYMIRKGIKTVFRYNGFYFETSPYASEKALKRVDVGKGPGGDVLYAIDSDGEVLELTSDKKSKKLNVNGFDLSVGKDNRLYVVDRSGVKMKRRIMETFVKINDIPSHRCSAGTNIWVIGEDDYPYEGVPDLKESN